MESKIKFLLRYAILAPSGHNSQPWKFWLKGNRLEIQPDFERKRVAVDPDYRELFIALGCAAKNLEVAADYFGMIFKKRYDIDVKQEKIAIVYDFEEGKKLNRNNRLFEAIIRRQTNRGEYESRGVSRQVMTELKRFETEGDGVSIRLMLSQEEKEKIGELAYVSNKVWFKSKQLVEELDEWLTDDVDGKDRVPSGMLNLYKIAVGMRQFLTKDSPELEERARREKQAAKISVGIVLVESEADGVENWIKTGEAYEELALKLTSLGLAHAFFNTVVELRTQREKLARLVKSKNKPQMLLRIGYAQFVSDRSPRRDVKEVLISTP